MRIAPADFARQLTTLHVTGVDGLGRAPPMEGPLRQAVLPVADQRLRQPRRRRRVPRGAATAHPAHRGRAAQAAAARAPEPRWCDGEGRWHEGDWDEAADPDRTGWLRLVRFEGGRRGPVLLAAGFGMSATSFLVDTVATNLTEHLVNAGYDVWLFDYRASTDLPSAR